MHMHPGVFPAVSTSNPARRRGASRICGRAGWAQLKGRVRRVHGLDFLSRSIGSFNGSFHETFLWRHPLEQLALRLFCRIDAPSVVPPALIRECNDYRSAVKLCWQLRRVRNMTQRSLAEEAGLYAPHVTCYLYDSKRQRDLPAWAIRAFELACGNTAITQWLNQGAKLTILEELQAERAAA